MIGFLFVYYFQQLRPKCTGKEGKISNVNPAKKVGLLGKHFPIMERFASLWLLQPKTLLPDPS